MPKDDGVYRKKKDERLHRHILVAFKMKLTKTYFSMQLFEK